MDDEISLKEKVDRIFSQMNEQQNIEVKKEKIKIPRKAKVRRGKMKKGWIGILKIDENGVITGEKQRVEDSAFTLKGGTTHATDGHEILFWEGKFPVIVQETKSLNPVKFNEGENQTYGQKYVLAKILKDTIKTKGKGGNIILWIIGAAALFFGAKYIFGF